MSLYVLRETWRRWLICPMRAYRYLSPDRRQMVTALVKKSSPLRLTAPGLLNLDYNPWTSTFCTESAPRTLHSHVFPSHCQSSLCFSIPSLCFVWCLLVHGSYLSSPNMLKFWPFHGWLCKTSGQSLLGQQSPGNWACGWEACEMVRTHREWPAT